MMNIKNTLIIGLTLMVFLGSALPTFAHVVVKPEKVGIGSFQIFSTGVPSEKDIPTIGVRLVLPTGLKYVSPNVKPGWNIEIIKNDKGDVTEINWTGGSIPAEQRDEFNFSAQVPADETILIWKAYQTYLDGSVVEWIHEPAAHDEKEEDHKPYSTTDVVNDLDDKPASLPETRIGTDVTRLMSSTALALAAVALVMQYRKKINNQTIYLYKKSGL